MSDIMAIFGTLLVLAIIFPGFLTACWLLLPAQVGRARQRVASSRARCFWVGLLLTFVSAVPMAILFALPLEAGPIAGLLLLAAILTFASIGAAGLAAELGRRLQQQSDRDMSPAEGFLRAAVLLECAAAIPLIGWLVVIPLATITALGASWLALWGRRTPIGRPSPGPSTSAPRC